MEKSKVYFTDFRVHHEESLTHKLQRLLDKAGLGNIDMDGKYVAIKMHFGELGNLAFLRPNWAKAASPSSPTAIPSMWAAGRMLWIT